MTSLRSSSSLLVAFAFLLAGLGAILVPSPASAAVIHAHRGGPIADGAPAFAENSMAAFRHALAADWVIELDLQRTADGVAVVMHDDTLDRTTNCAGKVQDHTWESISSCALDRIGIGAATEDLPEGDSRREAIPTLDHVLALLEETGGRANVEVKDLTSIGGGFPAEAYAQIAASGVSPKKLMIQNFFPPGLRNVDTLLPGATISVLTLNVMNDNYSIETARAVGADSVSPEWPISAEYISRARADGLAIVPWTIDDADALLAAEAAGVDAVITNDPALADRLVGPKPVLLPRLKMAVRASGKARIRPGAVRTFTVTVTNSGQAASGPVRITVKFPRKLVRPLGAVKRTVKSVRLGKKSKVKFRFRVRPKAKPGRVAKITFSLREANRKSAPVLRKSAKVRVVRRRSNK